MMIHVLPGDAIVENFKASGIGGEIIVCRECLIDGNVQSDNLEELWEIRAAFIQKRYSENKTNYQKDVVSEFQRLINFAEKPNEIVLWFEYELFCQINMWFCVSLLEQSVANIFRVAPIVREESEIWKGFAKLNKTELQKCLEQKTKFSQSEILHGKKLWQSFQNKNYSELHKLSLKESVCYPKLAEVCRAEIERETRPKKTLQKIISGGETEFHKIFEKFTNIEGIYGFGDSQVKSILKEI